MAESEKSGSFAERPTEEEQTGALPMPPTPEQTEAPLFKILRGIEYQLCRIADKMGAPTGKVTKPESDKQEATTATEDLREEDQDIVQLRDCFPKEFVSNMSFEPMGDGKNVKITLTKFLGTENFNKLLATVRELGGEYKGGKNAYFLVPRPVTGKGKVAPTPAPTPENPIDRVKSAFPSEIADLLNFTQEGDAVIIKPKQFLGSENFSKIASIVRSIGGEYISEGKNSRFKVP